MSSNKEYLSLVRAGLDTFELERLSTRDRLNEYLLTGLRAKWGVDLKYLKDQFRYDIYDEHGSKLSSWSSLEWLSVDAYVLRLTDKGLLFADFIASELFVSE